MSTWLNDAKDIVRKSFEQGDTIEDAVRQVVAQNIDMIRLEAEDKLNREMKQALNHDWAEPAPASQLTQLRFQLDGNDYQIPDTPVKYVREDGTFDFKPASLSTGAEREDSVARRHEHHKSHLQRAEREHTRETRQNAELERLGIPALTRPWMEIRHLVAGDICWRCGGGYRGPDDPFERGHCDKPASQGGTRVAWEHRSCNRSARDNPVA